MSMNGARSSERVVIVGAGLAGCEAAWQLARRGIRVRLLEMKPGRRTPAHASGALAELVCSNSLGNERDTTAAGLLKAELERAGSLVLEAARRSRVPAGGALAVDREAFADEVTGRIRADERIDVVEAEVEEIPDGDMVLVATGPMTAPPFSTALLDALSPEASPGDGLHYWDAIAPIVESDSVDPDASFVADRWAEEGTEGGDYVNCPMDREQYEGFVEAVLAAEKVPLADFEQARFYEGCLPIEVLASRGPETLAFGPMRPAGLRDPRTGERPHAVLQLRREDRDGRAMGLVGCQTRLTRPAQAEVFRRIPALREAAFLRWGQIHRNTFVDAPRLLGPWMQSVQFPGLHVTGQLCGVEGYTESTAAGLLAGLAVARRLLTGTLPEPLPETTACGGLMRHLSGGSEGPYQPTGINWSLVDMPTRQRGQRKPDQRRAAYRRGLADFERWFEREGIP